MPPAVGQTPTFCRRSLVVLHMILLPLAAAIAVLATELASRDLLAGLAAAWGAATVVAVSAWKLLRRIEASEREKRFLDEQLLQSQKLAALGELSAGVAHEINNPIAIVAQEAEWLKHLLARQAQGEETAAEILDSVQEIQKQVDRCRDVTHKMLNLARKTEPVLQETDLARLVEDMALLVEKEASRRGVSIERRYQPDLPRLCTDPPLLRQVAINLLNNAFQAVGENGRIIVDIACRDGFIEWRVSDTGPGIPKDIQDRIFNPFFTTKPPGQGTGLGLSICHGIVTRLGGAIGVESEPGQGASFVVRLPVNTSCLIPVRPTDQARASHAS